MPDYKKLYFQLFNEVTDIIESLKLAQQKCEELYIESSTESEGENDEE